MIELLSRKVAQQLPTFNSRDRTQYRPLPTSPRGHRRQLSLSSFDAKKTIWAATTAAFLLLLGLATWVLPKSGIHLGGDKAAHLPTDWPTIPVGKSQDRNGHEVFWWEQFPRLNGYYTGIKGIVSYQEYVPEQHAQPSEDPHESTDVPELKKISVPIRPGRQTCYIDEERRLEPPTISAYQGVPQGMSLPLFGSQKELGIGDEVCYDRINRYAPYGLGFAEEVGGLGVKVDGDNEGLEALTPLDYRGITWGPAQTICHDKNNNQTSQSRNAFIIRTWHTFKYTPYHIMMLRALISELSLASGGEYYVHFLIHVQDESIPIWASEEVYNQTLQESLPPEFEGMGTLWSVAQMRLVYPPPFPKSVVNFSGGDIYSAYRSLHFPLQYWASQHPEFDYFWQWEMDMRVTGHYRELIHQMSTWAETQPRDNLWERSSQYFIPALYDDSYAEFSASVASDSAQTRYSSVKGPQLSSDQLLPIPNQDPPSTSHEITDLITLNPIFDPSRTRWAFHEDITGYLNDKRPPTRASLITASRMSRRLLQLMHSETYQRKHTMFPEMFPASIALHYGLKAVYVPLPIYFDRDWPATHANEIFNNAKLSDDSINGGMDHGNGHFHGEGGSVFGPGEHVFRGSTYYSNAGLAQYLWRRWLGRENGNDEIAWEFSRGNGRMCLPMMVLHPIKED